jgi:hypothetical protein
MILNSLLSETAAKLGRTLQALTIISLKWIIIFNQVISSMNRKMSPFYGFTRYLLFLKKIKSDHYA